MVLSALQEHLWWIAICLVATVAGVGGTVAYSLHRHRERVRAAHSILTSVVNEHLDTLARQRLALIRVDRYGVVNRKAWDAEIQHFISNVFYPCLSPTEQEAFKTDSMTAAIDRLLEQPVRARAADLEAQLAFDVAMSPIEYEGYCARLLEKSGWRTELTKASGDQGADIIAHKNGQILIVQCKKYQSPVGNKAVQEVVAAVSHHRANIGAVVATNGYTRAAQELAGSTGTMLLRHSDLLSIDSLLKQCGFAV